MKKNNFFKNFPLLMCVAFGLSLTGCGRFTTTKLTVASYNVKCLSYGSQLNQIAEEIKMLNPDIIGLQELDSFTIRSGKEDQIKLLAENSGYKYYCFTKTISYDGGEYGHGIMSKYPIKSYEAIPFENQDSETRCYSRSVIDVNGKEVVFYNTHLEYMGDYQTKQMAEIVQKTLSDKYFIITGDMNCEPQKLKSAIDSERMIMLNGGETCQNEVNTCPEGETSNMAIDNIIVSRNLKYYFDSESDTGIMVNVSDNSDHNMIYTKIEF